MSTIQNILFPVDFSPSCVAMAAFVKRSAAVYSARVTLLHVVGLFFSGFELYARPLQDFEEDRDSVAREKLRAFLAADFPPHECTRIVSMGDPARQIVEVARGGRFDLIVMPTHAGVFRRTLLGSTTAKVLNDSDSPVLTTQHVETISPRPIEHRELVCALGLQPDSERVLRYASQIVESTHANLSLVHAIPATDPGAALQFDLEERVQSAERHAARRQLEELQRKVGSHAPIHITVGPIKDALTETARRLSADVLMIGRSPEAGVRLRDLTYAVVRDAPCPVMSV